jgi:hypothetical protein
MEILKLNVVGHYYFNPKIEFKNYIIIIRKRYASVNNKNKNLNGTIKRNFIYLNSLLFLTIGKYEGINAWQTD